MNIIGIDPGAEGALAVLTPEHDVRLYAFKGKSERDIIDIIAGESIDRARVFLEFVHAYPGQGATSTFTFGKNLGLLRGALLASGMSFEDVPPQTWQKGLGLGKKYEDKPARKKAHRQAAQQWFPQAPATLNIDTCDALLIAEYGYRLLNRT